MSTRIIQLAVGLAAAAATVAAAPWQAGAARTQKVVNTYTAYAVGINGGEPSIGFDPVNGAALYGSLAQEQRLVWDDSHVPATMTSTPANAPTAVATLDSITFIDQITHRSFDVQLAGACSLTSYSDDDGKTWLPSQGCGENTLLDHETLGAGPFHAPLPANAVSQDAVYYCAQNGFNGTCAVSLDGGITFGPGIPAYDTPQNSVGDPYGGACSALHGHLRVGPDGTAYLALKGCGGTPTASNLTNTEFAGGHPSLSVSEDNGTTWTVRMVTAGQNQDESDPSVGIASDNTLYFGWENGTNPSDTVGGSTSQAKIAVSRDHGLTWSEPYDVSTPLGLHNVQFPEVIAGDGNRAAFAFLGTPAVGDDQADGFAGEWHLYIATTYDGGRTWSTVDTTPHDPVQRGCIDMQGIAPGSPKTTVCSQRNLLDFNDITVDKQGRVLVAYAKGCTHSCVHNPGSGSMDDLDMVMRQTSGRGLYAAYDGTLGRRAVTVAAAPKGGAASSGAAVAAGAASGASAEDAAASGDGAASGPAGLDAANASATSVPVGASAASTAALLVLAVALWTAVWRRRRQLHSRR